MSLKDIAAVSGKPGLYRILKPTRSGVVLESLDEKKTKLVTNTNYRVSVLKEISIYTTSPQGSLPLEAVLLNINEIYGTVLQVGSHNQALDEFIAKVVPDYDADRVYSSDIKKLITWYKILVNFEPTIFEQIRQEQEELAKIAAHENHVETEK